MIIPGITNRLSSDINLKAIFIILHQGTVAHLQKRSNIRLMLNLAIEGLQILNDEMPSLLGDKMNHETYKLAIVKYYELSNRFCINEEDSTRLKNNIQVKILE